MARRVSSQRAGRGAMEMAGACAAAAVPGSARLGRREKNAAAKSRVAGPLLVVDCFAPASAAPVSPTQGGKWERGRWAAEHFVDLKYASPRTPGIGTKITVKRGLRYNALATARFRCYRYRSAYCHRSVVGGVDDHKAASDAVQPYGWGEASAGGKSLRTFGHGPRHISAGAKPLGYAQPPVGGSSCRRLTAF